LIPATPCKRYCIVLIAPEQVEHAQHAKAIFGNEPSISAKYVITIIEITTPTEVDEALDNATVLISYIVLTEIVF
jgi:hypothetical protein